MMLHQIVYILNSEYTYNPHATSNVYLFSMFFIIIIKFKSSALVGGVSSISRSQSSTKCLKGYTHPPCSVCRAPWARAGGRPARPATSRRRRCRWAARAARSPPAGRRRCTSSSRAATPPLALPGTWAGLRDVRTYRTETNTIFLCSLINRVTLKYDPLSGKFIMMLSSETILQCLPLR